MSRGGLAFVGRSLQSASGNGWLTFSTNPTNGQTIILNGITWTFVTSGASGNQTNIRASLALTLAQLKEDLAGSSNAALTPASYSVTSTILMIRYKATQANGFAYTLDGGTSGAIPSGPALTAYPARPITFQFSNTQGYGLEFGDLYLRFVFQGGYILENPVSITGATNATTAIISVSGTPFVNGDWVFASGVGGMTQLNGNTYMVAGVISGSFALLDLNGTPVNSTTFGTYTSGGSFSRVYTISTPYAAVDLPYLKFSQSADLMRLTCSNPSNLNEYPSYDLTRLSAIDWTLVETDFDPVIVPPATVSASAESADGVNATFAYQVTAIDSKGNESLASASAFCNGADIEVQGGTNTVTWSLVTGAKYYNIYRAPPATNLSGHGFGVPQPVPAGTIFGFVGSSNGTQFLDTQPVADLTQTPPTHQDPFAPGQILAVDVTIPGSGITALTWSITTSSGIDFAGYPVVVGGSLGAFPIVNGGKFYQPGDTIAFNGAGFASGAIDFTTSGNPSPNDTITLNGTVWTFVTSSTGGNQTVIAGALSDTLSQLVSSLSASSNVNLAPASYSVDSTAKILLVTYKTAGTAGNSYTLAASAANPGPSGSTLTGGSGSAGAAATGSYTFGANPTNGQTIIVNGITWTFVTSGATGAQTNIGGNTAATLTQLQLDLTASGNVNINIAHYSVTTTALNVVYATVGTAGNSFTLGAGTYGATLSGAHLTGGIDGPAAPAATLEIGPETGTYPGVNAFFQQRSFFANSLNNPDTFWATQTGLYENMDTSIPTVATDAITATPWTEQVNGLQWLIPMPGGLIAMTGNRAWQLVGEGSYQLNSQPVTPATTQAQPQAFNGCSATIPPIVIDQDVLYVEAVGATTVRDLAWNVWVNIYTGSDLTLLSSHLFLYQEIVQWAWSRKPYKILWACRDDGTMLSLTYLKEQEVYGWARHDTQGLVLGMTAVTEPPVNAIYAIVKRLPPYAPQGIYCMERMDNRIWQSVEDAYAVDSGVSNPMTFPQTFIHASSATGSGVTFTAGTSVFSSGSVGQILRMGGGIATITGYTNGEKVTGNWVLAGSNGATHLPFSSAGNWSLSTPVTTLNAPHLAGMTLVGLADGVPISGLLVGATGTITLPFAASNVKVGLGFTAQLQTPYLNGQDVMQGARKVIPAATFRLAASGNGFQWGTNQPDGPAQNPPQLAPAWTSLATANTLNPTGGQSPPPTYTSPGGQSVTQLWTGDLRIVGQGGAWNSKGQIAIQQTLPLALEVTAVEPEVLPGDIPEVKYSQDQQQSRGPGRHMIRS